MQLRRLAREGPTSALEPVNRCNIFRDSRFRTLTIQHHQIGGITNRNAIIVKAKQVCRALGEHVEAGAHIARIVHLTHIGVQIRHADQRPVAEWREGIQDVVRGQCAIDARMHQFMRRHDAATPRKTL